MADYVNKVKKRSEVYRIEDTQTKEYLNKEIARAVKEEEKIKEDLERVQAKADYSQVKLNILSGDSDDSIQGMIDSTISHVTETTPEVFKTIKGLGQWMETDETGAAAISTQVNTNRDEIQALQNSKVYLSMEEWEYLLENNLVQPDIEYNIYEEEE